MIVSIVASPKSGATLLALILASREKWGTFGRFPETSLDDELCSCGKPISQCNVRKDIKRQLWDPLPRPFKGPTDRFLFSARRFLRAETIVETSHTVDRAIALAGSGFEQKVVHLVRDPRDVYVEHYHPRPEVLAWQWVREQKQTLMLQPMIAGELLSVRFEDLVESDPLDSEHWSRLWDFLDVDPIPVPKSIRSQHVIGNQPTLEHWNGELDASQVGKWRDNSGKRMSRFVSRLIELGPSPFRHYTER